MTFKNKTPALWPFGAVPQVLTCAAGGWAHCSAGRCSGDMWSGCVPRCAPGGPVHREGFLGCPPSPQGLWGNCQLARMTYISLFILGE